VRCGVGGKDDDDGDDGDGDGYKNNTLPMQNDFMLGRN
jgi:hypothetical protein